LPCGGSHGIGKTDDEGTCQQNPGSYIIRVHHDARAWLNTTGKQRRGGCGSDNDKEHGKYTKRLDASRSWVQQRCCSTACDSKRRFVAATNQGWRLVTASAAFVTGTKARRIE